MPTPICVKCETELRPEENGVTVAEMFQDNEKVYKLWEADIWWCPVCGFKVVIGFANNPFKQYFDGDADAELERLKQSGKTVVYNYELTSSYPIKPK